VAGLPAESKLNRDLTVHVEVRGNATRNARIVWEARDQEPAFGNQFTFTPRNEGNQWIEVEVQWPDGRRAFAVTNCTTVPGGN